MILPCTTSPLAHRVLISNMFMGLRNIGECAEFHTRQALRF